MVYRYTATARDIVLYRRVLPLLFGTYAWNDEPQSRDIKDAGSGILIAPRIGLIAKHVSRSFNRLDPQFDAIARRRTPFDSQYRVIKVESEYAAMVYQVTGRTPSPVGEEQLLWKVKVDWPSYDTDINVLALEPGTEGARLAEPNLRYLEWHLLPPPCGAPVLVFGFPEPTIRVGGDSHELDLALEVRSARVAEILYPIGAHGFSEFAAFRLDRIFAHGVSGGAVLYNGRLAGIFSGPDLVACLWPLALVTYPSATTGADQSLSDLLDVGTISAWDWDEVRGRIRRAPCDEALARSSVESRCDKSHAILDHEDSRLAP